MRGEGTAELPYVFFDLGETIVNLRDTIGVLASVVANAFPAIGSHTADLSKSWFVGVARSVPRDPNTRFESQYAVGTKILARLLREAGMSIDDLAAGQILRTAWDRWQQEARLCEGVTHEWLGEVRRLSAGVGAVTDGDEEDVRRLLGKMRLSPYFDSVTTSEAVMAYKPNPVVYRTALASLTLDLQGAQAVGLSAVWLRRGVLEDLPGLPTGAVHLSEPSQLNGVLVRYARTGRLAAP